jgi:hypothetical protein
MQPHDDPARAIKIGLLAVIGLMSWPVWGAIIAGEGRFDGRIAASALVPLGLTLLAPALAFHVPERVAGGVRAVEHALHVDSLLHHGRPHRHA